MAARFSQLADALSQTKKELLLVCDWWRPPRLQFSSNALELSLSHSSTIRWAEKSVVAPEQIAEC